MPTRELPTEPLPVNIAARYLRVPARWLLAEVQAGRLPALVAGDTLYRVLVDCPTVAAILAERARVERVRADTAAEGGEAEGGGQ